MAENLPSLDKLNAGTEKLSKSLTGILGTLTKIGTAVGPITQKITGITAGGGMMGLGTGSSMNLGTNPARFSTAVGPAMAGNAVAGGMSGVGQMAGGVAKMGLGLAAGAYMAMPDLGTTVARASGYYGASVMGGINRSVLQQKSVAAMRGGITGMGEDAAAAAMLVQGMYYNPRSVAFTRTMQEVGGAARMLNMPNATAAQALGGMQQGPMAGNMYQFGIMTLDAKGNPLPFEDIAKQLYQRSFAGRNDISRADVLTAAQGGFLGADLRNMGFSASQQELLINAMGNFAEGKGFNLAKATGAGNPMSAAYQINQSQTDLMQRGEQPMLQGFQTAANVVSKLNKAMEGLPDLMFQFKGAVQGFLGTSAGQGTATAAGGFMSGLKSVVGGIKKVAGAGMVVAGLGTEFITGGASTPASIPLVIGGAALMSGGGGRPGYGASFGAKGGSDAQSPIPGMSVTTSYGAKDANMWKGSNNKHTGQDYAAPVGTKVQAVADGTVIDEGLDSGYGIYVQLDHHDGYQSIYGHLSKKNVKVGDTVKKGQVVGLVGTTGNVTGPHLHFEVRKGKNNPVDPGSYLKGGSLQTTSGSVGATQTNGVILGNGDQQSWAKDFLTRLGKPTTSSNIKAVTTWMAWEGGHWKNTANYNPLNTTLNSSGATSINKVGVKAYQSYEQGMQATLDTIKVNKYGYPQILKALSSGTDTQGVIDAVNSSKWGTHIKGGGAVGFGASIPTTTTTTTGSTNNVNITVNVQNASDEEAIRFAKKVKKYLDNNASVSLMGSN